jgi:hypothetical protein
VRTPVLAYAVEGVAEVLPRARSSTRRRPAASSRPRCRPPGTSVSARQRPRLPGNCLAAQSPSRCVRSGLPHPAMTGLGRLRRRAGVWCGHDRGGVRCPMPRRRWQVDPYLLSDLAPPSHRPDDSAARVPGPRIIPPDGGAFGSLTSPGHRQGLWRNRQRVVPASALGSIPASRSFTPVLVIGGSRS